MNETTPNVCDTTGNTPSKNGFMLSNDTIEENIQKYPGYNRTIEMKNKKFGRLTIIERAPNSKSHNANWKCQCECGQETIVRGIWLRNGTVRSCGCFQREQARNHNRHSPYKWILTHLKSKKRDHIWNSTLTYDELLEFVKIKKCHYCNGKIEWSAHSSYHSKQTSHKYNLDRKNNDIGYTRENCVVCCTVCNYFKGDRFSYEEMVEIGKVFEQLRLRRTELNKDWVKVYSEKLSPNEATLQQKSS